MNKINSSMIRSALNVAKATQAEIFFLYIDALDEWTLPEELPKGCSLILASKRDGRESPELREFAAKTIFLPQIKLGKMGMIKLTLALALSQQLLQVGNRILFLSGTSEARILDTLLFIEIGKDEEIITTKSISEISEAVKPEVFEHLLGLALELASQGREGKPIGTIFVVGDEEKVMQLSKQMIINPFKGYSEEERNILNPQLKETLREFAAIDGAFVISENGIVLAAGRYLGAAQEAEELPRGLGSRHIAAAGITALTKGIAIVISESTGDVRIFQNGKILMQIEKN